MCIPILIQAAGRGLEQAPRPTQNPPTPFTLPGQPQASTHKSVKSSRVSSGVNTSSSPITWGGGQAQVGGGSAGPWGLGHSPESGTVLWAEKPPAAVPVAPHCTQGLALPTGSTDVALAHLPGYFGMVTAGILGGGAAP